MTTNIDAKFLLIQVKYQKMVNETIRAQSGYIASTFWNLIIPVRYQYSHRHCQPNVMRKKLKWDKAQHVPYRRVVKQRKEGVK